MQKTEILKFIGSDLQKHLKGLRPLLMGVISFFGVWLNMGKVMAQALIKADTVSVGSYLDKSKNNATPSWMNPASWYNLEHDSLQRLAQQSQSVRDEIHEYALNFLGIRYRSSGKSPKVGFDCSGFTGFIFKHFDFRLKSSSTEQAKQGEKVPVHQAQTGDLAFFGRKGRKGTYYVNHAAIVISKPGEPLAIIHSASNKGIVITRVDESRYWRNSLLFVRNVL